MIFWWIQFGIGVNAWMCTHCIPAISRSHQGCTQLPLPKPSSSSSRCWSARDPANQTAPGTVGWGTLTPCHGQIGSMLVWCHVVATWGAPRAWMFHHIGKEHFQEVLKYFTNWQWGIKLKLDQRPWAQFILHPLSGTNRRSGASLKIKTKSSKGMVAQDAHSEITLIIYRDSCKSSVPCMYADWKSNSISNSTSSMHYSMYPIDLQ